MKSINEFIGQELQWVHPRLLRSEYELRAGDELLARIQRRGAFRSQVYIETAAGSWLIERKCPRKIIAVLLPDAYTELATIKRRMNGQATLSFPDGREFRWQCTSFWGDIWTWLNVEDTPLLHLKRGVYVQLEPASQDLPELALLTMLGWYLHKQQEEEAATAAAVVPVIG